MAAKSNYWRKPVARRILAFLETEVTLFIAFVLIS